MRHASQYVKLAARRVVTRWLERKGALLKLALKQNQETEWPALTDTFSHTLTHFLTLIARLPPLPDSPASPATRQAAPLPPPHTEPLLPRLQQLATQLARFQHDSVASFTALKPALQDAGFQQEIAEMARHMGTFNFIDAQTSLSIIIQSLNHTHEETA